MIPVFIAVIVYMTPIVVEMNYTELNVVQTHKEIVYMELSHDEYLDYLENYNYISLVDEYDPVCDILNESDEEFIYSK